MVKEQSILDWVNMLLTMEQSTDPVTKSKIRELRKRWDESLSDAKAKGLSQEEWVVFDKEREDEFLAAIQEMNMAGGYDAIAD